MRRVKIYFKDGEKSYAYVDDSQNPPKIIVAGAPYEAKDFAATGATVAVNDNDMLKLLTGCGINARPTGKQITMTISITHDLKSKLTNVADSLGRSTTSIMLEAAEKWLKDNGY